MASSDKYRVANGMTAKVGMSAQANNGAPVKSSAMESKTNGAGTNGARVNGGATNGANGH